MGAVSGEGGAQGHGRERVLGWISHSIGLWRWAATGAIGEPAGFYRISYPLARLATRKEWVAMT